jgi:hypothetical protein
MSYSTVMVHLDLGSTAERRVKLAGSLADRFDAVPPSVRETPD